jgi:NAD(P)-dependent dehydrogenase (short-subunit alcohol dehydrogenase family)
MIDLSGKHIFITGASSGIGRATAILLSQLNASLTITGRDSSRLLQTYELLKTPGNHFYKEIDMSSVDFAQALLEISRDRGRISGLVHCAGIHEVTPLASLNLDKVNQVISTNVLSTFEILKHFSKRQHLESKSSFVFLASVAGFLGQPGISAYSASKGALIGLVKSVALELARQGTRVNAVAPGVVETEMTERLSSKMTDEQFQSVKNMHPLGIGRAEDVANAIAFLLSEKSNWITGTTLIVDGGYSAS